MHRAVKTSAKSRVIEPCATRRLLDIAQRSFVFISNWKSLNQTTKLNLRFVNDDHAIAFLEVEVIGLSLLEIIQRPHDQLRCKHSRTVYFIPAF